MHVTEIDLKDLAKQLRSDGYDAGAILVEIGVLQSIFDFSKRCRAENIHRADQIDALAKLFASVIMPFASGIPDVIQRASIIGIILDVCQNHMTDAATAVMKEDVKRG